MDKNNVHLATVFIFFSCLHRDSRAVWGQDSCSSVSGCGTEEVQWAELGRCFPRGSFQSSFRLNVDIFTIFQVSERKTRRDVEAAGDGSPTRASNSQAEDEDAASVGRRGDLEAVDGEGPPFTSDGYFSLRHYDSASLSSFSLDTPSLPRKVHAQEDTDSLVSTGTLVPEAIYLPPAGHRLVTHSDWDALNTQVSIQTYIYLFKHFT